MRNDELLQQGPREAPEPQTAEERTSVRRAGVVGISAAAVGSAVAKFLVGAAVAHAIGVGVGIAIAVVLAALIVGDAVHRFWVSVRERLA